MPRSAVAPTPDTIEVSLLDALTSLNRGDFSVRLPASLTGQDKRLAAAFNELAEHMQDSTSELLTVSHVVGREGRITQRLPMNGAPGAWAVRRQAVNSLIDALAHPTSEMARVIGAVADGDLSQKMTLEVEDRRLQGEFLRTARTVNRMVDQLSTFASEVTRVAREVGTEGKLGGQARLKGVAGTWRDLTDNVNLMASNLTSQVRNIATVTTAVANGNLTKKITVDVKGELLELKNTINTMVDQLRSFASEVTRVAREVGTEGRLGGQARVEGVSGTWKDLTDNVNSMAGNLTGQVRNIAAVTTAVANGDLSKKITVDVKGEILELKNTINTMVDQLRSFASEVTRVAREVGTEGKLGGQADVRDVAGTWKDLTDSVNSMASNLTGQVRNIAAVTTAVANGDLSKKITVDVKGEILELKNTINTMVDQLRSFASEVTRVAREVGTEGKLGGQADVRDVAGTWKDLTDSVNSMASNLTGQVRNIAAVTTAVANGDLSKKITVDVKGEILELKNTINTMVDQLRSFASEVTRVAREVGSEGRLGGQAQVEGVAGTWKDLTDSVNLMAGNLTDQVRGIARVVTAVANGDLTRRLTVEAKGEIAELADTINAMTDTLATFADQVTTVAREVGVRGRLGGQARVPGAAGTWRALTDNVNQLAANLTTQVRAIAEVATAVTKGDLTRSIAVEAQGELAALKDNINEMIGNLKDTTSKNSEQDWLKTNLAKFTRMLQGQKDLLTVGRLILSELATTVDAQHGCFYMMETNSEGETELRMLASYAYTQRKHIGNRFRLGEGLVGQAAFEKNRILLTDVPSNYVEINSGLGAATPLNIVVLPVLFEGKVKAVIELASFHRVETTQLTFLDQLMESIGIVLNTIEANMRTESLLEQSQSLAKELQSQQNELQQKNEELEEKARLLASQNVEVERQNQEIELARRALEEKASQLALTSRYKSEFLANMSHELRTPLNSLLILADQLASNADANLSDRQVEYAQTIHASGNDLLRLINDILDLAKIESGTVVLDIARVSFRDLTSYLERTFRPVAESKGLAFEVAIDPALPPLMRTDVKRLQQVLKNLASNALKFTERGGVTLRAAPAAPSWSGTLGRSVRMVQFEVRDTGIGVPAAKQSIIFEAFQQGDGSTSRRYGGTGLGLTISREIARLLGGDIGLVSAAGMGSTFTLYLPLEHEPAPPRGPDAPRVMVREAAGEPAGAEAPADSEIIGDTVEEIAKGELVLLHVGEEALVARTAVAAGRLLGLKCVVAARPALAMEFAQRFQPRVIALDVSLPEVDGWRLLRIFKSDPATRTIPILLLTAGDDRVRALRLGAAAHLALPADRATLQQSLSRLLALADRAKRRLLVIKQDQQESEQIARMIGNGNVVTVTAATGREGLAKLELDSVDCVILDPALPDMNLTDFLREMREACEDRPPIVVYPGVDSDFEDTRSDPKTMDAVVRGAPTPESLLDDALLFLHYPPEPLRDAEHELVERSSEDFLLGHRRVLLVDDDVRNLFALTSLLERHGMEVSTAENGTQALERLETKPNVDIILMDVMMPDMDGYETMRAIRRSPRHGDVPIVAVTAKAMKGDREKCLEAGASDYVAKPIDSTRLLSAMKVWLCR